MNQSRTEVVPANADVPGPEDFPQFVADEVDDGLEVELRSHPLLDAVDDGELARALLEPRVRRLQFGRALRDLALETLCPLRVVERNRGLAREQAEQVAIRFAKAPEHAVEVGIK